MKRIITLFLISCLFGQAQIPMNGLIGGWPFNGNANDISTAANHGSVVGAVLVPDRFNNPASAYQFDGINDFIVMMAAGPTGSVSRSVSFWAKTTKTTIEVPFNYGEAASPGGIFQVVFNYGCEGVGFDNSQGAFIEAAGINNDLWHHIVLVYDASLGSQITTIKMYFDGTLLQSVNCSTGQLQSLVESNAVHPITIGRSANSMVRMYDGCLDDFYFYNRPLQAVEVLSLYNYKPCSAPPSAIGKITGPAQACFGTSQVFSVATVSNAAWYNWYIPGGWSGSSTSNTILVTPAIAGGNISVAALNSCGSSGYATLYVNASTCTGITASDVDPLVVYPNPFNDRLTVVPPNIESNLSLVDLLGRVVKTAGHTENSVTWDCADLPGGVYYVRITTPSSCTVARIIHQ